MARVLDRRSGRSNTTYEIPNLDNALLKGGLLDWEPGQSLPVSKTIGSETITVSPKGRSTRLLSDATRREGAHRFRDLENNKVPMLLSEAYQGIDSDLATFLSGQFGGAIQFTQASGGAAGAPLDDYDHANAANKPDVDINEALRSIRVFAGMQGMKLECWMGTTAAQVLARHGSYTGAGVGSGISSQLVAGEFTERFKAIHMLDDVRILDVSSDTGRPGQDSTPAFIHNVLLWFGLVDRRGEFDLTNDMSGDSPDGAIVIGMGRQPEVVQFELPGTETEYYAGRTSYDIFSPRGETFGFVMDPSGAGGIIT